MDYTAKKMSKIIDELIGFLLRAGADDLDVHLRKRSDGFLLTVESNYLPEARDKVKSLDRFLQVGEKNEALEEFFWQLAGVSSSGSDSEIHLIGQMVDRAQVKYGERTVSIELFKAYD